MYKRGAVAEWLCADRGSNPGAGRGCSALLQPPCWNWAVALTVYRLPIPTRTGQRGSITNPRSPVLNSTKIVYDKGGGSSQIGLRAEVAKTRKAAERG